MKYIALLIPLFGYWAIGIGGQIEFSFSNYFPLMFLLCVIQNQIIMAFEEFEQTEEEG